MTFREKLAREHPELEGDCEGCPYEYGFEKFDTEYCRNHTCTECWDREIPTAKSEQTPTLPSDSEAYNKSQETLKVGDVVFCKDTCEYCVITLIDDDLAYGLYSDGSCGEVDRDSLDKSDRHIDISAILAEIEKE